MRVLQVIPSLEIGGAERFVANLARHLSRAGHEVGVVSLYGRQATWIEDQLQAERVRLFFLDKHSGLDPKMIPRLHRVMKGFRPEVLHTHLHVLRYVLPAWLVSRRCRIVHTVHTAPEGEVREPLFRLVQLLAYRTCAVVPVAIGDAVADDVERVYGLRPRHVIPNGIPVSEYASTASDRREVRATLGLPTGAPALVCVGRFSPVKNHAGLLRAFASRRLRELGAHLVLAGDGAERPAAEALARSLGIADRVHFLGARSDVPSILSACDVFVLSSSVEGNPLSVMEAMAAGKPIVATAVGCIPELVVDGTGRVVPAGSDAALESAMYELAADPARIRAMGAAAARRALERFDDSRAGVAYEHLYAEIT